VCLVEANFRVRTDQGFLEEALGSLSPELN
jgi:hypothetical protein